MDPSPECDLHRRHIVLVVGDVSDDEPRILTDTLQDAGFDAIAVETGGTTLKLLASGVEPCVVVIDVDLPDMNGWELWRSIHELDARTGPATLLASSAESLGTPAGVVPIDALLRKPAAIYQLIDIIERHCPKRPTRAVA